MMCVSYPLWQFSTKYLKQLIGFSRSLWEWCKYLIHPKCIWIFGFLGANDESQICITLVMMQNCLYVACSYREMTSFRNPFALNCPITSLHHSVKCLPVCRSHSELMNTSHEVKITFSHILLHISPIISRTIGEIWRFDRRQGILNVI